MTLSFFRPVRPSCRPSPSVPAGGAGGAVPVRKREAASPGRAAPAAGRAGSGFLRSMRPSTRRRLHGLVQRERSFRYRRTSGRGPRGRRSRGPNRRRWRRRRRDDFGASRSTTVGASLGSSPRATTSTVSSTAGGGSLHGRRSDRLGLRLGLRRKWRKLLGEELGGRRRQRAVGVVPLERGRQRQRLVDGRRGRRPSAA